MKVIEFMIKIANNTLEDTCFKYDGNYFKYWKSNKQIDRYADGTYSTVEYYNDELFDNNDLNKEIEIIEEDKEIEEISAGVIQSHYFTGADEIIADKLNEVIRKLNNIKKEGK